MPVGTLSLPLGSVLTGQPEVIKSTVLAAAAASVSFTFPPVYRAVQVEAFIKNDANCNKRCYLRINNDSGANYSHQAIEAYGSGVSAIRTTADSKIIIDTEFNGIGANARASLSFLVTKTTAASKAQMVAISGDDDPASIVLVLVGGQWNNTTDLMSRIDVLPSANNFAANTAITLWGYRL